MKAMAAVTSYGKSTAVKPFKDDPEAGKDKEEKGENDTPKDLLWCGPKKVGCVVLEIHGPLQLVFIVLALFALFLIIFEACQEDKTELRIIAPLCFLLVCLYIVWLAKGIYVLKWMRMEIIKFRKLNGELKGQVETMKTQNEEYERRNEEHEKLNTELSSQVKEMSGQNATYQQQNAEYEKSNTDLKNKVGELSKVERRLALLTTECNGNVHEAKSLIERLERNVKLDTVNSVFLFFDRTDRDKNGRLDPSEIALFVDNLSFLWKHLPSFDKERMKATLIEQGGMSLEQVHDLVDAMMVEDEEQRIQKLRKTISRSFTPRPSECGGSRDNGLLPEASRANPDDEDAELGSDGLDKLPSARE